jgi:PAS domain S-box-containing protein
MPRAKVGSQSHVLKAAAGYAAAICLPWAATYISFWTTWLRGTPMALCFAVIAGIAVFFGARPALAAVATAVLSFNYYILEPRQAWSLSASALVRSLLILAIGLLIVSLIHRMQQAQKNLRDANLALQEHMDALVQAQQGSGSAAWLFNTKERKTSWYAGGAEVFGRSLEEITAMGSPTGLVLEEDLPKVTAAAVRTAETGEPFHVEFRVVWPGGEIHWLEASGKPAAEDPSLWRGVTSDITERKLAEEALIRSEKLGAAGRLAASIAHEINNPLASVTNLVYLARLHALSTEARCYLETAEKELGRVAQITSQTLRFHKQQSAPVEADLAETLRSILLFYESRFASAGITVVFECGEPCPLTCYEGEMRQVFNTLLRNAVDAMAHGGRLRLRVRPATDWRSGAAGVRVTIADTGHGIPQATRKRIYEPFFTTKEDVGAGLGLWVASGIVENHKGSLHVRSSMNPGESGSAFTLILPQGGCGGSPQMRQN